ncbi:MAG TPA: hypothetical protein VJZ32_01540 [Candidatus Bathyarchaeia archaeon]|nr:hypothetical protein [Candidatus Bathyarchaeia archaeon]
MSKDQGYGFAIFLVSIIIAIVYLIMFFSPWIPGLQTTHWYALAVGIPVLLFVLLILVISGWIGWTMLTTPPPAPLEPEPATEPSTDKDTPAADTNTTKTRKKK